MNETFPHGFNDVGESYFHPPGDLDFVVPFWVGGLEADTTWATRYTFQDQAAQGQDMQVPAVFCSDPPYTSFVVQLSGDHYLYAGSTTAGDSWLFYTGVIEYYVDHGDNTAP